jgi:large subunit ribosomal protein L17
MKHGIKGRKLNRTSAHRKALLSNLAQAFLKHEMIKTTLPKAKELRPYVEKIITIAKKDSLFNRRRALSTLGNNQDLVNKLFTDIGVRVASRNGGYTRIMHFGFRTGDKAPMAVIELVDRQATVSVIDDKKEKKPAAPKKTAKVKAEKTAKSK